MLAPSGREAPSGGCRDGSVPRVPPLFWTTPMRTLLAAALLAAATPALADTANGTVFAYDAKTNILVLDDKTIWQLGENTIVPDMITAGDKIIIDFTSAGDDGIASVESVKSQTEEGA